MTEATDTHNAPDIAPRRRGAASRLLAGAVGLIVVAIVVALIATQHGAANTSRFNPDLVDHTSRVQHGGKCPHPTGSNSEDLLSSTDYVKVTWDGGGSGKRYQNCDARSLDLAVTVRNRTLYRLKRVGPTDTWQKTVCDSPFWAITDPVTMKASVYRAAYHLKDQLTNGDKVVICSAQLRPDAKFIVSRVTTTTTTNAQGKLRDGREVVLANFFSKTTSGARVRVTVGGHVADVGVPKQVVGASARLYKIKGTAFIPVTSSGPDVGTGYAISDAGCSTDPTFGFPEAYGQITNQSSAAASYTIHVAFDGADGTVLASGFTNVGPLPAGATGNWQAQGPVQPVPGVETCPVTGVTVFPTSPGMPQAGSASGSPILGGGSSGAVPATTSSASRGAPSTGYAISDAGCSTDPTFGFPEAYGQITNQSSAAASYTIHVAFDGADGTVLASGFTNVGPLPAGATGNWQAQGPVQPVPGVETCPVTGVTVFPTSPGMPQAGSA